MFDPLLVRSRSGIYSVHFVDDFTTILGRGGGPQAVVVDQVIMGLYGARITAALPKEHKLIIVEARESYKTLEFCRGLIDRLVNENIQRDHALVAIGGGIVQDIVAFVASILFRGIRWRFFPTTLLAQADSCVGSKSSLNFGKFKNLLGTFYPPEAIYIDATFLETLTREDIRSGIGEILHFYLVNGHERVEHLTKQYEEFLNRPRLLADHIRASLEIKKNMVEIDEFDQSVRNLFNYGHTFGHAIETVSDYQVRHGLAVTIGMDIANYVSQEYGLLDGASYAEMRRFLLKNMPEFTLDLGHLDNYFRALSKDKKNIGNELTCILTAGLGRMKKTRLALDDRLKVTIARYFQTQPMPVA